MYSDTSNPNIKSQEDFSMFAEKLKILIKSNGGHVAVADALNQNGFNYNKQSFTQELYRTNQGKGFFLPKNKRKLSVLLSVLGTCEDAFWKNDDLLSFQDTNENGASPTELKKVLELIRKQSEELVQIKSRLPKPKVKNYRFPVKIVEILWPFLGLYGGIDIESFSGPTEKLLLKSEKQLVLEFKKWIKSGRSENYICKFDDTHWIRYYFFTMIKNIDIEVEEKTSQLQVASIFLSDAFLGITPDELSNSWFWKDIKHFNEKTREEYLKNDFSKLYYNNVKSTFKKLREIKEYRVEAIYKLLGRNLPVIEKINMMINSGEIKRYTADYELLYWIIELYIIWFLFQNVLFSYKGFINRKKIKEKQHSPAVYDSFRSNVKAFEFILELIVKDIENAINYRIFIKNLRRLLEHSIDLGVKIFFSGIKEDSFSGDFFFIDLPLYKKETIGLTNKISNLLDSFIVVFEPDSIKLNHKDIVFDG